MKKKIAFVGSILCIIIMCICTFGQYKLYRTGYCSISKEEMMYETISNQLLVDAERISQHVLFDMGSSNVETIFSTDNSNLRYKIVDEHGEVLGRNTISWVYPSNSNKWYYEIYIRANAFNRMELYKDPSNIVNYALGDKYTFCAYINPSLTVKDEYRSIINEIETGYKALRIIYPLSLVAAVLAILFMYLFVKFNKGNVEEKINTFEWHKKIIKWTNIGWDKFLQYFRKIAIIKRTAIIIAAVCMLELLVIHCCNGNAALTTIVWFFTRAILLTFLFNILCDIKKIKLGAEELAEGHLEYKIQTEGMNFETKKYAESMNHIGDALNVAIEKRLQSERMKTELITNVSHDIKTPITSIINYAVLIEKEPCDSPKHKEYAEVLVRKSTHLKRLLDDLVEASKASTGAIEMKMEPCEANVLLSQVVGEFEQRFEDSKLALITKAPAEPIMIQVDSKRIWRVFENLMMNACKYSLEGSRVYLNLDKVGNEAIFSFRNTSKAMLNVSADELMERFVRGDSSRSTEGNGLGLSIAKSLTELQNGKMDIIIDGDLFKVILKFPLIS